MILDDADLKERLESEDNICNIVVAEKLNDIAERGGLEVRKMHPDVGKRGQEIPSFVRALIANVATKSSETQAEVAEVFGVSQPKVSEVSRGLIHNRFDAELAEIANKNKNQKAETAHEMALEALVGSIAKVYDALPGVTNIQEAVKVATGMAKVVTALKKKEDDSDKPRTLVIIPMPTQKHENQFETIDV